MLNRLPPNVLLAIVVFAAAAVALRAAARRPEPRWMLITHPAPAKPPPPSRPDGPVEQMQLVFHELHADGPHALCEVCGN